MKKKKTIIGQSEYMKNIFESSGLKLLKPNLVVREYTMRKELGLFNLFLHQHFLNGMHHCTN